ncbi:DsbA family protein [Paenibacillus pedocola]|uniref:DsbA family protein n=1 Tax=Paenibacillus pedocola TaxID=3242193 RepID=UPI0028774970|nr:thioredoxin domain-containing protein [Paenibacillus typhae]
MANTQSKKTSNRLFVVATLAVSVIVLAVSLVFLRNSEASPDLGGLPNYTEIRGDYDADGLKYEKQPHLGDASAKVKVIEFADFKCPACKKWKETYFEQFRKDYVDTGKVELFFINFAFIDRDSILAASAGEAIAAQNNDKFWEFMSMLYDHQGDEAKIWATPEFLRVFVKKNIAGIDYDRFATDLKNHTYMLAVKEDFKTAGNYGVNGTPQFMVDGKLLKGGYGELTAAIDAKLAAGGNE